MTIALVLAGCSGTSTSGGTSDTSQVATTTTLDQLTPTVSSGVLTFFSESAGPYLKSIMNPAKAECIASELLDDSALRTTFEDYSTLTDSDVGAVLNDPLNETTRDKAMYRCMSTSELVGSIASNPDCCQEQYTETFKACLGQEFDKLNKSEVIEDLVRRNLGQSIAVDSGFRGAWQTCGFSLPD